MLYQDIEATLHCIRYSSEAVPLGEDQSLPVLFGEQVLGPLTQRPIGGLGEDRLRLTIVCLIRKLIQIYPECIDVLLQSPTRNGSNFTPHILPPVSLISFHPLLLVVIQSLDQLPTLSKHYATCVGRSWLNILTHFQNSTVKSGTWA